jgi:HEAT repeat protein
MIEMKIQEKRYNKMVVLESVPQTKKYPPSGNPPGQLNRLVAELSNPDGIRRQQARVTLSRMGEPVIEPLIETLHSQRGPARWEAAKALSQIGSPKAARALVEALEDDQFGIRWLAAEGLIALGRDGLKPLLEALGQSPDSIRLREGAHHVLHDLVSQKSLDRQLLAQAQAILTALSYLDPVSALPAAVMPALKTLN